MEMSSAVSTTTAGKICRVIVVDDHAIMRDGLSSILDGEPELDIVGTAGDGKAAVAEVDRLLPDIVIMDLTMPRTNGSRAITEIKRKHPEIGVVVLTFHKEDAHIHSALLAGADAYVLKDDGCAELLAAGGQRQFGHAASRGRHRRPRTGAQWLGSRRHHSGGRVPA